MGQRIVVLRDAAVARAEREQDRIVAFAAQGLEYKIQPTIQHLVERYVDLGDRAGALVAVRAVAAAHMTDDNPGAAAWALYFGWVETRDADLRRESREVMRAPATEVDDRAVARSFIARRDAHECAKITRCNLRWRREDASFVGALDLVAPVAASWLASCSVALAIDGTSAPILCMCEILRMLPNHVTVRCVPDDATASRTLLRKHFRTNATGTCSNLRYIVLTPPAAPSRRVFNAYYAPHLATMRV